MRTVHAAEELPWPPVCQLQPSFPYLRLAVNHHAFNRRQLPPLAYASCVVHSISSIIAETKRTLALQFCKFPFLCAITPS